MLGSMTFNCGMSSLRNANTVDELCPISSDTNTMLWWVISPASDQKYPTAGWRVTIEAFQYADCIRQQTGKYSLLRNPFAQLPHSLPGFPSATSAAHTVLLLFLRGPEISPPCF